MEQMYEKQVMQKVQEVFEVMDKRVTGKEMEQIREAFDFASTAHAGQRRKSGEPYIIHPIEVARIVAVELELGAKPVTAAFLHDVVEDTEYTIDDIQERFGKGVSFLVSVLTKQHKDHYEMSQQVDNYRQMLSSIHYDIRALLIKLADRLHNMRTLGSMPVHKQMKIAGETDFFYAPLANRLGLYPIKIELENLSFRYRCPQEYEEIAGLLRRDELLHEERLRYFTDKIRMILGDEFGKVLVQVKYRAPYSILRQMQKTGEDFSHIPFRHVVDIIFPCEDAGREKDIALGIYSRLTSVFNEKPLSVISYIDNAKENGYQAYHVQLLSEFGSWEEVHISSERMVRNNHLGVVAERREDTVHMWIDKLRKVLRDLEFHPEEGGYMDNVVTAFYNDNIMVFTPKGKPINLPKKATALDFAFEIHSHIGEHAHYAWINGQLSSVKTELQRGDVVEIVTSPDVEPKADWADHVLTYRAKGFLKRYFSKQERPKFHLCPECHPIPGEEVIGFKKADGTVIVHKRNCHVAIGLASQQGDSIVPVDFEGSNSVLYPVSIQILAVDRAHLLSDMINSITNELNLSIDSLNTCTEDCIVRCTIKFGIHSYGELQAIRKHLQAIDGIEEVRRI